MRAEERIPNERLRQARILKGWTQSKLAEVLGTDCETVSRWECGKIIPGLYFQKQLADVFEKTLEELGLLVEHDEDLLQPLLPGIALIASYPDRKLDVCFQLKERLQVRGIQVIGNRSFRKLEGEQKQKMLREVFRVARIVVLLVSPLTRASRHVQAALPIAKIYKCAIYALWLEGECWQQCLPMGYEDLVCAHDMRANCDVEKIVKELEEAWFAQQEILLSPETSPDLPEPRNPYKGLKAFGNEDREDFFGRDQLIEELVEGVRVTLMPGQPNRLLAVVGPSGSGKSSVVLAGLVPRLQASALPGSAEWLYLEPMVPGQNPLASLAQTLAMFLPQRSLQILREDLEDDSTRGLHLLAGMIVKQPEAKVLLCIDQFEEVFTQTSSEEEREQFLAILMTAITEPDGPVILILTMRSDFDDRPMSYPRLSTLMEARRHPVLPMTLNELQMTIEKPATHPDVQLTFEEDLVGDLLFDVQGQVGTLPLLQFTLDQLFHQRKGCLLTQYAYHDIGGLKGALAKHAEDTYQSLPTQRHQYLARALFLRLIDAGTIEQDATKRRAALAELIVSDVQETAILTEVRITFTQARLLTTSVIAGTSAIEISHEALIRAWSLLTAWMHEARDDLQLQKELREASSAWMRRGQPTERLYRGVQLDEALVWRARNLPSLDEETFLHASNAERERQRALEALWKQQVRRRTLLWGAVSLGLAAIAFPVGGYLLPKFVPTLPSSIPTFHLPYTYIGHKDAVEDVAWSPDSTLMATASLDKMVQVWDAHTGHSLLTYWGHKDGVNSVVWSPDSTRLASASLDGTVQVWDAHTGYSLFTYHGHKDSVRSVAWSPDSKWLASASDDKTVQVWDAHTGHHFFTYIGHRDPVRSVAWSPDNKWLASASDDKTAQVWDAHTGYRLLTYRGHTSHVRGIAWSPDSKWLASASLDKTVQVWNAYTGHLLLTYRGHTGFVVSVAWSLQETWIASASIDTKVQVWLMLTGK